MEWEAQTKVRSRTIKIGPRRVMPDQITNPSLEEVPDDPAKLVAEYRRVDREIGEIVHKQSKIHKAAGGRLIDMSMPSDFFTWIYWRPPFGPQEFTLNEAEEIAMRALNDLEEELAEKRQYLELLQTKAAIEGVKLTLTDEAQKIEEITEGNVFRHEGRSSSWTISFAKGTIHPPVGMKGLVYIQYLLEHQREHMSVADLAALTEKQAVSEAGEMLRKMSREQLEEEEGLTTLPEIDDAGEAADKQTRTQSKARLKEIAAEKKEANTDEDWDRLEKLEEDEDDIARYLSSRFNIKGRPRKLQSRIEQKRINVKRAIDRAIDRIADEHSALGTHLKESIKTGFDCSYRPDRETDWLF